MTINSQRRLLFKRSLQTAGALAFANSFFSPMAFAAGSSSYRALVCIDLAGGNDAGNVLIPRSNQGYQHYAALRGNLAIPQSNLLPINTSQAQLDHYGLHPNLARLQTLYAQQKLAFVANIGPMQYPVSKADLSGKPQRLHSHNNQSDLWDSGDTRAAELSHAGWAGRIADLYQAGPLQNTSIAGNNRWQSSHDQSPFVVTGDTVKRFAGRWNKGRTAAFDQLMALADEDMFMREYRRYQQTAIQRSEHINTVLEGLPPLQTPFPATKLGKQLKSIARLIQAADALGQQRQTFYAQQGGFDTHSYQKNHQPVLFTELSEAIYAFQSALEEIGKAHAVTGFTSSEFGRTLASNGSGSDHGWGGHSIVFGGAVRGGNIYGNMPQISANSPDLLAKGIMIPTTSVEQYAATLSQWYGLNDSQISAIFPNLGNFSQRNLGFV